MLRTFSDVWKHRDLIWQLTKRDVTGRYRDAGFGMAWSLLTPFIMLAIYTFAFGTVMKGRWPGATEGASFSLVLFAGLLVHGFFAECITRGATLVTSQPNFVKRVVFPLEILPWPLVLSAAFHLGMNLVVFTVLRLLMDQSFTLGIMLVPVIMLPLAVLCVALSWWLAALGVFFRDVSQVMGLVATATLFLSSAVTPQANVSPKLRWVIELNPITFIVDQVRNAALWGHPVQWGGLFAYLVAALVLAWTGRLWFTFARKGFADVI